MRISDWSSDVCSSDLEGLLHPAPHLVAVVAHRTPPPAPQPAAHAPTTCTSFHPSPSPFTSKASSRASAPTPDLESEERRVGKKGDSTCISRWSADYSKKKKSKENVPSNKYKRT